MLTVRDVMSRDLVVGRLDEPINVLFARMKEQGGQPAFILDDSKLVGVVTEGDVQAILYTAVFFEETAASIMTRNPISVSSTTPAHQAATILNAYQFTALPVVDDMQLVGMVSIHSFLLHLNKR